MSDKIITYNFSENFLNCLADYLEHNFLHKTKDLSRIAIVFGGKRPALFLKKELSRRLNSGFYPPRFFSADEFIRYIAEKQKEFRLASDLDQAYLIYNASRKKAPQVLHRREEFAEFLPWAREISRFIDELDLEDIPQDKLKNIQASASIGYEIPENVNKLLMHIMSIIEEYHSGLRERNLYSRGLLYKEASGMIPEANLDDFDRVLFCNFYYLHKTEEKIIKHLFDAGKAALFFQKDSKEWPVFQRLSKLFGEEIKPRTEKAHDYELKVYKGFDTHSQVGLVRSIIKEDILKQKVSLDKSLILLCEPNSLVPLLSEIASEIPEFNVSMGYPLKRSSLYSLLQYIFSAQATRKDGKYYTRDYLRLLLHPLIKNLLFAHDPAVSRILAHKIEEILLGMYKTPLSGSLFVRLEDIESCEELYRLSLDTMVNMETEADIGMLKDLLFRMHRVAFRAWEDVTTFAKLVACLEEFSSTLLEKSIINRHPLNLKILEKILEIVDELKNAEFRDLTFPQEDIFKILESKLKEEKISFLGSPLKGLQILGLFETRALSFENVIIMDANESVLPKVAVYEPLIPRQIMEGLGLERLKQEEEIQRYHFMRLLAGAKNAYFVYDDSPEKERSRFLEEIIWERQKSAGTLKVMPHSVNGRFNVSAAVAQGEGVKKSAMIADHLIKEFEFSASSIDDYLACPLRFYYRYVLRLKEKEDLLDETEARDIGNFLHDFLDYAFRPFIAKPPVMDGKFREAFFNEFERRFAEEIEKRMGHESFMVHKIMEYRLKKFLENESRRKLKSVISLEEKHPIGSIELAGRQVRFKYRIDRVDELSDGSLLVIDYKTGFSAKEPEGLDKLRAMEMNREGIKKAVHSFQLPIYYYFTRKKYQDKVLNAALYNLRDLKFSYFIKPEKIADAPIVMECCLKGLEAIVSEITDPKIDFYPDKSEERTCQYCPFGALCR